MRPALEMLALLLVALLLHFWNLSHIPPGLDEDSAANGWIAVQWLRGGPFPFWNGRNGAAEPLMVLLQTAATALWGPSIFALRGVSALAMALAAPVAYALAYAVCSPRHESHAEKVEDGRLKNDDSTIHTFILHPPNFILLQRWGARFAGLTVAVSPVMLELGRTGLRATLLPVVSGLLLLTLLHAVGTNRPRFYAAGGLLLGVALYTYLATRVLPVLVGAFLLLCFWAGFPDRMARRRFLMGSGLLIGVTVVVTLPQIIFFVQHPDALWARAGAVTLAQNPLTAEMSYASVLAQKLRHMARMFGLDWWGQYNQAQRPLLQPLAFAGFLAAWPLAWHIWRTREARQGGRGLALMVMALPIMLIPDLAGGDRLEPHSLRVIGALLPAYVLSGLGLAWLFQILARRLPHMSRAGEGQGGVALKHWQHPLTCGLGAGMLLLLAGWSTVDWLAVIQPRLAQSDYSWYAREDVALAGWINAQDEPVLVPLYELSRPNLAYLTAARAGEPRGGLPPSPPVSAWLLLPENPRPRVEAASYHYDPTTLVLLAQDRAWLLPSLTPASLDAARAACPQEHAIRIPNQPNQIVARACAVDFAALAWRPPPDQPPNPPAYRFDNDLTLLAANGDTQELADLSQLGVNLAWQSLHTGNRAWRMYVHLVDDDYTRLAGEDFMPAYGLYGTEMWQPGPPIPLRQLVPISVDLAPGRYWLEVGLYDPLTGSRSHIYAPDTGQEVEQARFGPLKVALPPPVWDSARKPPLPIHFGDTFMLTACDVDVAADRVTATFRWEALSTPPQDYIFFLHVTGPDGVIVAQHDAPPLYSAAHHQSPAPHADGAQPSMLHLGVYPTGIWSPGEVVVSELTAWLPPDMIEADYTLWLGAYDSQTNQRLTLYPAAPDQRAADHDKTDAESVAQSAIPAHIDDVSAIMRSANRCALSECSDQRCTLKPEDLPGQSSQATVTIDMDRLRLATMRLPCPTC